MPVGSQPLQASSYLVFVDSDVREVLNIKAYDQSSNLIANGVLTFSRQNGNTADGALLTYPTWNTLGGYTGSFVTGTFASTPGVWWRASHPARPVPAVALRDPPRPADAIIRTWSARIFSPPSLMPRSKPTTSWLRWHEVSCR